MNSLERLQPPVFPVKKVVIPKASLFRLNNGVPVYMIESGTEEIMRIEFTFKAGQVKEHTPLLATTTNLMLSEGSQNYSSEEINRQVDFYGAFFNLSTDKDRAGIIFFFLNKHIDKILELTREMLFRPLFPEAELGSLMKKRLHWYLVNRGKVQNLAVDKFFESVFGPDHPYGHKAKEEDFKKINQKLLTDFHFKYYTPDNMAIIVSGKFHKKTTELLNFYFGDLINPEKSINKTKKLPIGINNKKIHINKPESVQSAVRIGSSTINKRHPDYPGMKFLDSLLGGYFSSRLMKNIREDKGFTYGISSSVSSLDLSGYKVISTEVSKKNCQKTVDEIYSEIRLLQTVPVEKEELEVVRNNMSGEMIRMFDGPFALAESFKSVWQFGLDNIYYYRLAEKIRTIDPDEIIELARTYYNIAELYEITAGAK
jgi:zinc protease